MIHKKHKSISWKTALGIVVSLHLAAYGAITQYSSHKKKVAEELKQSREKLYAQQESKPEWNNNHIKPRVVGIPKPQKPLEKQTFSLENKVKDLVTKSVNGFNESLVSINNIKIHSNEELKKIENPFSKKETKTKSQSSPITQIASHQQVIKSTPKPIVANVVHSKPVTKSAYIPKPKTIEKTSQIPSISHPSGEMKVRNIIIEADGSVVETSEETRRVVSSQVVL